MLTEEKYTVDDYWSEAAWWPDDPLTESLGPHDIPANAAVYLCQCLIWELRQATGLGDGADDGDRDYLYKSLLEACMSLDDPGSLMSIGGDFGAVLDAIERDLEGAFHGREDSVFCAPAYTLFKVLRNNLKHAMTAHWLATHRDEK